MSSKLKTVRAAHRRAVIKRLKKGDMTEEPHQDVVNLRSMMELIKTKQKTLSDLNEKILESMEEEEDLDEEIEEVDRYELEIQIGITKIEKFIKEVSQSKNQSALNPNASDFICNNPSVQEHSNQIIFNSEQTSLSQSSMPTSTMSSHHNKLPKLNLLTFSGNLLEWSAFWDSYNNSVQENPSLSDVQRSNYLKSQLYGEVSQCILGVQMTNTNYNQAIQSIHERFGQQHKIVSAYMQNLPNFPAPMPGIRGLKSFSDTIESNIHDIRELEGMGRYKIVRNRYRKMWCECQ
ncbi:uncharacterized protein [Mytilus edulis]|uniref:uncharacterized protein n=1 Tax=Mytilus edulis TaxID=6550 RepID=UPI0039EEACAF